MFFIYSTIIFAPFSLFSHITFVILLFGLSFSVSLRCKTGSLGPGFLPLCYGMWPYCDQFPILLPPPDCAFSVSQCHSLKPSGGYFSRSGSTPQELVLLPRPPFRLRLFEHVLAPNTVLHFLFVYPCVA
jgi:hypothetical protein